MPTESFSVRRAYLKLSDEEFAKIQQPVLSRCIVAWYVVLTVLSIFASAAFFFYATTNDPILRFLDSLKVGLSSFIILIFASVSFRCTRCIIKYSYGATFRKFCGSWQAIDGL
jgi:hypothetical protein